MQLPLIYYGNPILRQKCAPVTEITDDIKTLVADMIDTMKAYDGVGLAAPQVGRLIRLFIACPYIEEPDGSMTLGDPIVYINPKVHSPSDEEIEDVEGCLSIPGLRLDVYRPEMISIEAMDLNGNIFHEKLEGYNARTRMHENDHINGVLYIDRVSLAVKKKIEPTLKEIKKKYNS